MVFFDWAAWLLYALELLIFKAALLFCLKAARVIAADHVLHYNFRALMILAMIRCPFVWMTHMYTVIYRVFVVGEGELPLQNLIDALVRFAYFELAVSFLVLSVERGFALFNSSYERSCTSGAARVFVPAALLLPGIFVFIVVLTDFASISATFINYLTLAAVIISGITGLATLTVSKRNFSKRHQSGMRLNRKFATVESIRAANILLPCLVNEFLCFIVLYGLALYSIYSSGRALGSDPRMISHIFDLIASYQCLFIPVWITFSPKYTRKLSRVQFKRDQEAEKYFQEYQAAWN